MQCYRTLATVGLALIFSLSCLTANAQVPPNYPNSNNDWGTQVNPAPLPAHKAAKQEGTNPYVKSGPELGLDLGYGYLNTPADDMFRDTNINIPIPEQPDVTLKTATSSNHTLGGFVWGVHGGYNFAVSTNTLLGFEVGYKDLGRSKYSSAPYIEVNEIDPPHSDTLSVKAQADISRKVEEQDVDFLLTAKYFVWRGLNVIGKAGLAYVGSTTKQSVTGHFDIDANIGGHDTDKKYSHDIKNLDKTSSIRRFRPEIVLGAGYKFNDYFSANLLYDHIFGSSNSDWDPTPGAITGRVLDAYSPPKAKIYSADLVMLDLVLSYPVDKM